MMTVLICMPFDPLLGRRYLFMTIMIETMPNSSMTLVESLSFFFFIKDLQLQVFLVCTYFEAN